MHPFSQSKDTFKVAFVTKYQFIELFEQIFQQIFDENLLSVTFSEIESKTIEAEPDDIWKIEGYLDKQPTFQQIGNIKEQAGQLNLKLDSDISFEKIEDQDWVKLYQQNLKPIEVGNFFISSVINREVCPSDKIGIYVEAARAFGTGDHETTSGCIEAMDSLADLEFNAILDLGCGSGILAFAAEKLWPKAKVLACDIEEVAVDIANQNAITNGSKILFYQNNEEQIISPPHDQMRFDLIVSNILASPLISLSQEISKYITPDGYLILSGFLEFQLEEVQRVYESLQFEIVNTITKNKWVILVVKVKRY